MAIELLLELTHRQPQCMASALYDRPAGGAFSAHEDGDTHQTFVTY